MTLWVTDANGTSSPASVQTTVRDLTGDWQAQFNVQTRTYTLRQIGKQITGNYLNSSNGGQVWALNASAITSGGSANGVFLTYRKADP